MYNVSHLFPGPIWLTLLVMAPITIGVSLLFQALNPQWVQLRQAEVFYRKGDITAAEKALMQARELGSGHPALEKKAGRLALALEDWPLAKEAFLLAVKKNPKDAGAASSLAGVYQQMQQPEEALHVLLAAREAGARFDSDTQMQLAGLYRQLKLYPEAEEIYRQLLTQPAFAEAASVELAEMWAWQGQYAEAIPLLREVLQNNPENRMARITLARVLSWAGQADESIREYQSLLQP